MKYDEARVLILDGDLIAVKSRHGGFPAITRFITRSPYTHTAIAVWLDAGLWVAEMGIDGNRLVPLSHYSGKDFEVFECPVDRKSVRYWTLEVMREPIDYDVWDLLRIAGNRLFGIPLPADKRGKVCSTFNGATYLWAGWQPANLPPIHAPDELVRELGGAAKLSVEG